MLIYVQYKQNKKSSIKGTSMSNHETSPKPRNRSGRLRNAALALAATAALASPAVSADRVEAHGKKAEAASVKPEKKVRKSATKIASRFISEYRRAVKNPVDPNKYVGLSDYDEAGKNVHLTVTKVEPNSYGPSSEFNASVDMKRVNGRLDPSTATTIYVTEYMHPRGFADEDSITMYNLSMRKNDEGEWKVKRSLFNMEYNHTERARVDTEDHFNAGKLNALTVEALEMINYQLPVPESTGGAVAPISPK